MVIEFLSYDSEILNFLFKRNKKKEFQKIKESSTRIKINLREAKIYSVGNKNKIIFNTRNKLVKSYKCYIEMEPEKLKLWFLTQKETFLYINNNNKNDKYLDLEFMNV
ncbi:hypothetical protein CMU84_08295 [Elizabethkingia anophelis]|nr:hypothetical protein [Elizabethkingia anophelis]MDV3706767.1 hypothetical protein [Elizabethkingia anophelis]MDV3735224.1 hypothetical protein [Elizabethkingia anophelis]